MEVIEILENSELFGGFERKYLEKIAPLCRTHHFSMGETIFSEGGESKELYILVDGILALEKKVRQAFENRALVTKLEEIRKGEAFGWSGMIEPHTFASSVRCLTDCEVLCMNTAELRGLMESDPALGYELVQRLARLISSRMTYARDNLARTLSQARLAQEL